MSAGGSSRTACSPIPAGAAAGSAGGAAESAGGAAAAGSRALHTRSFKLRFAPQREPGRSYLSLVKPLGLPSVVAGGVGSVEGAEGSGGVAERAALARVRDQFARGPRDRLPAPLTTSHQYGWHAPTPAERAAPRGDRRLQRPIRDSAWLKARLLVLAADDKLKQR